MGLAWQQGPLAPGAIGRFLVPDPLPERLLYAEPLRRRMRVRFGGTWIADSEDVVLLHEPGRYPVAYFPAGDIADGVLEPGEYTTRHQDLGARCWYAVQVGTYRKPRVAWQHTELPGYASDLKGRIAFAWRAMDAFYEEDERIFGHAADRYHRIDIRQASRHLLVRYQDRVIADTTRPLALYESGFAPRWYVPRADVDETALTINGPAFCPYKGLATYYDIGDTQRAAWSYEDAWAEVRRICGLISFEPHKMEIQLDGTRLRLEPDQTVIPHGPDCGLATEEVAFGERSWPAPRPSRHRQRPGHQMCRRTVNKQVHPAAAIRDGHRMPSAGGSYVRPDAFAVSPAVGPLPAIYVPASPGRASPVSRLGHAAVRAARQAGRWAVRTLSQQLGVAGWRVSSRHQPAHRAECRADRRNNVRYLSWRA
jgi:uncharacterized protein (DUF427 family)